MSFQKHLMMRLAVDKLGATYEETPSTKAADCATVQLTEEVPVVRSLGQTVGAALRALLIQSCPSYFGQIKTGKEPNTPVATSRRTEEMMQQETITLVQQSWQSLAPIAPQAAELFYQNLFAADPGLKALFHNDMREQGHKLMRMIGAAVSKLDDTATLLPIVADLGRRHARYGVQAAHYQTVGAVLLTTLGQGLGDAFTPAVRVAWAEVYGVLAATMLAAATDTEASNKENNNVHSE